MAMRIVAAAAHHTVEQLATDVCEKRVVRIFVDQFVQAAAAAAVAQAFPFRPRHLGHRLAAPKRGLRVRHSRILASPCSRWRSVRHGWSRFVNLSHSERPFNFCWRRRPAARWPMGLNFLARLPPPRRNRYQRLKTASKHLM